MFTQISPILRLRFAVIFGGSAALCAILSANNFIIAQIPTAEVAVATNWVALAQKRGFACAVNYSVVLLMLPSPRK